MAKTILTPEQLAEIKADARVMWLRKTVYHSWRGDAEEEITGPEPEASEEELDAVIAGATLGPRQLPVLRLHACGEARRPCPRTDCRLHLNHTEDKRRGGAHPGPESCSLDMIDQTPEEELTLAEIGDVLGMTRERVRQIEASALRKLSRNPLARQLIGELVGKRKKV